MVCFRAPRRNIKLMVNSFWRQRVLWPICNHLHSVFFVGGKLWLLLQHTQGTAGIRDKLDQIGHSSSSSCIATKPGEGLVLRALPSCSLRDLRRSATTAMRGGIKPGLHDLACHTAGCFEPKRPGSKRINCDGCDQR